jgi:hypothetical protein
MSGIVYGGKFEQTINELYSPKNLAETVRRFTEYEKQYGPYSFGKFTKFLVPQPENWVDKSGKADGYNSWEKNSGEIPEAIRNRITEVIATNLRSATPLPLVLKVGDNVDATHELLVKTFAHNGHIYIGLHMLCPNPGLK